MEFEITSTKKYNCRNKDAIKNSDAKPRYINTYFNDRQKCEIPDWCPFKKNEEK